MICNIINILDDMQNLNRCCTALKCKITCRNDLRDLTKHKFFLSWMLLQGMYGMKHHHWTWWHVEVGRNEIAVHCIKNLPEEMLERRPWPPALLPASSSRMRLLSMPMPRAGAVRKLVRRVLVLSKLRGESSMLTLKLERGVSGAAP